MTARTAHPVESSDDYQHRRDDAPPVLAALALAGLPPVAVLLVAEPMLALTAASLCGALWFARRTAG